MESGAISIEEKSLLTKLTCLITTNLTAAQSSGNIRVKVGTSSDGDQIADIVTFNSLSSTTISSGIGTSTDTLIQSGLSGTNQIQFKSNTIYLSSATNIHFTIDIDNSGAVNIESGEITFIVEYIKM